MLFQSDTVMGKNENLYELVRQDKLMKEVSEADLVDLVVRLRWSIGRAAKPWTAFVTVFHKDQSLVLSYSYFTLLLLVLLSLIRLSVIIYFLMTLNCSSPSGHLNSPPIFYTYKIQLILSLNNLLWLNQSKTEFLLIGLPAQISKISDHSLLMPSNAIITPAKSARYLSFFWSDSLDVWSYLPTFQILFPIYSRCSKVTLSSFPLLGPSQPLLFTPNLITATSFSLTFLNLNSVVSNSF